MDRQEFLSKPWVRMVIFAWMVVFPIVFIALPALEIFLERAEPSWTPVWGLIAWMLAPAAGSVILKWLYGSNNNEGGSST